MLTFPIIFLFIWFKLYMQSLVVELKKHLDDLWKRHVHNLYLEYNVRKILWNYFGIYMLYICIHRMNKLSENIMLKIHIYFLIISINVRRKWMKACLRMTKRWWHKQRQEKLEFSSSWGLKVTYVLGCT